LTCLGITFVAKWAGRQARFGVRISSDLGLIFPWNSHTRDSHRFQEEVCAGFLPRFARMRSQQAFEHGQKNTSTCSTRSTRARARPRPTPRAPRPRLLLAPAPINHPQASTVLLHARSTSPDFCQDSHVCDLSKLLNMGRRTPPRVRRALRARARPRPAPRQAAPTSPARACAYKSPSGVDRTSPRTLDLTGARNHRRLPRARRDRGHPSPCHRRPANRALPSHARPLEETVHASVKLPEQGIRL
jgi:hypothetical protein